MIDIAKLKKRLSTQLAVAKEMKSDWVMMSPRAARDLLNILEAQEPAKAELEGGGHEWWYVCGNCHTTVNERMNYCPECGKMLHFDDVVIETGGENG